LAKDYYEILGVSKQAGGDEIKRAFRNLARKHHPDVNKETGAAEKFKEINEAYQILSDPHKKQQYDTFGSAGPGAGGFGGFDFGEGVGGFEGFGDIFDVFFGGRQPRQRRGGSEDGSDLRYDLTITLEEAYSGVEKESSISHYTNCQNCKGTGSKPGTTPSRCSSCGGSGQVRRTQRTPLGAFQQITTCPACQGAGEQITSPCSTCHGSGRVKSSHKVKVKVPAGIDSGYRLRVSSAGDAGRRGGSPGDLYVFIAVREDHRFERQGADLIYKKMISFTQAALGDEVEIPTLEGAATLRIPAGTQSGSNFRFKGKGMPNLRGRGHGDLYVLVEIETPQNLTAEQAELLHKFARLRNE
jgi:molecular chaperone DnaJ